MSTGTAGRGRVWSLVAVPKFGSRTVLSVICVSTAALCWACSGAQTGESTPACGLAPNPTSGGRILTGQAPGAGREAERVALANALVDGLQTLIGVNVRSQLKISAAAQRTNGHEQETGSVQSNIEVSLGATRVRDFTVRYCRTPDKATRADVSLSEAELARLQRVSRNAAVGLLYCASTPAGACEHDLHDRIRALAQGAGIALSDVIEVPSDPDVAQAQQHAQRLGAARAFVVRLTARFDRTEPPYHVCRAQPSATLLDTEDGKQLAVAKPAGFGSDGGIKGMVYADMKQPKDACGDALRKGLKELEAGVGEWGR